MDIKMTDAWWEGYHAYQDGLHRIDNPYYSEDPRWEEWREGYTQAGWDD